MKKKNGKWIAEFYKNGKRIRRWFDTKAEATRFFNAARNPLIEVEPRSGKEKPQHTANAGLKGVKAISKRLTNGNSILVVAVLFLIIDFTLFL